MKADRRLIAALSVAAVAAAVLTTAALADRGPAMGRGGPAAMLIERFDAIDADKDGKITPAELADWRKARFEAADADKNGRLDQDELAAFRLQAMQERAGAQAGMLLERFDADGDGALSATEMPGSPGDGAGFARVDADGDGAVSKAEVDEALAFMSRHHGRGHGARWGEGMAD